MTQLDRLEALAEAEAHQASAWLHADDDVMRLLNALPDLIRVARAAKRASDLLMKLDSEFEHETSIWLIEALEPLFAEVES